MSAGATLEVTLQDTVAANYLAGLADGGVDTTSLMDDIAGIVLEGTQRRFDETNTAPDGTPWTPSERVKRAQGNAKILKDTGALRGSLEDDFGRDWAQVGTNLPYGNIHQQGGRAGRNQAALIEARPYLGLSGGDRANIEDAAIHFLEAI